MADTRQQSVDLTNCDREPIHIPGSIQPHGALLAFDNNATTILRRSDNAAAVLGFEGGDLNGKSLLDFCTPTAAHEILNAFGQARAASRPGLLLGLQLRPDGPRFDISAHFSKGSAILEFERTLEGSGAGPLQTSRAMIAAVSHFTETDKLLEATPRLLRGMLGYDRVMIYRFAQDESGKVIAESKRSDLEGFFGQHFPGSDIPQQARRLYLQNTIRIISDSRGDKSDIYPVLDASGEPLDLSFAHLRSVSPIHLEYLRNMGVAASMSISIIVEGKLWGLIACHHYSPRVLSMAQRVATELFGDYFSLQLEALTHRSRLDAASRARRTLDRVMRDVSFNSDIAVSLRGKLEDLRELLPSDGVGLWLNGAWTHAGVAPPASAVEPLMTFISSVADGKVWASHEISAPFPAAARYSDTVAGVLAIPLSQRPRDYLVYFRRELVQTLNWAGDPNKTYTTGPMGDRLTPRKSFAIWKETVERKSQPWTDDDREMADATRNVLLEVIMRHTEILESERETAAVRQKLLNEELNHRVKNILALIKSLVSLPPKEGGDLQQYAQSLKGRINALSFAHDQVMRSDGGGSLRALLEAEVSAYRSSGGTIRLEGPNANLDARAYSVMALVLHELTTNAAKYGALSRAGGELSVRWSFRSDNACEVLWKETGGPRVVPPSRQGFGSTLISRSVPFDLKGESQITYEPDGVAARILIPAQFVAVDRLTEAAAKKDKAVEANTQLALQDLRVLLVEDQLIIAMDAEAALLSCGAKSVDAVGTADEALRLLGVMTPDVCVLDVNLGVGTSLPVAEELSRRGIPFIFATGYADRAIIPAQFAETPKVRKPYEAMDLCGAIAVAMGRRG